jgi:FkbH-like protein
MSISYSQCTNVLENHRRVGKSIRFLTNFSNQYLEATFAYHLAEVYQGEFKIEDSVFDELLTISKDSKRAEVFIISYILPPDSYILSTHQARELTGKIIRCIDTVREMHPSDVFILHPPLYPCNSDSSIQHGFFLNSIYPDVVRAGEAYGYINVTAPAGTRIYGSEIQVFSTMPYTYDQSLEISRILATEYLSASSYKTRVVFIDCDNTLWPGEIAERDWDEILATMTYSSTFYKLQVYLKSLASSGVILVAITKNKQSDIEQFLDYALSRMPLDKSCFTRVVATWDSKALSIVNVISDLNLTTSGCILIDDSRLERTEARRLLPELTVPNLPEEHSQWIKYLENTRCIQALRTTPDDAARSEFYKTDMLRKMETAKVNLLTREEINKDLQLRLRSTVIQKDAPELQRAVQLINKTNQFNISSSRYSYAELQREIEKGSTLVTYSLADRLGDFGTIAAVLLSSNSLEIACFAMSCRSMGRNVECAILADIARRSYSTSECLSVEYVPNGKNGYLVDHLESLGFTSKDTRFLLDKNKALLLGQTSGILDK